MTPVHLCAGVMFLRVVRYALYSGGKIMLKKFVTKNSLVATMKRENYKISEISKRSCISRKTIYRIMNDPYCNVVLMWRVFFLNRCLKRWKIFFR